MLGISAFGKSGHGKSWHISHSRFGIWQLRRLCRYFVHFFYFCTGAVMLLIWNTVNRNKNQLSHLTWYLLCSQTALLNDTAISVNRCVWGPDGLILGMQTGVVLFCRLPLLAFFLSLWLDFEITHGVLVFTML